MTTPYFYALQMAALWHDLGKADSDNRLNRDKREANQGCGSAALLIRCGLRGEEAGLKLIREHHLRKRGDPLLRQADQISSRNRLEGGADNRFIKHFPAISARVKIGLGELFREFDAGEGYNHLRARDWVANNRWLDLIPADVHGSGQSLREHLMETEYWAKVLYADPATKPSIWNFPVILVNTRQAESWLLLGGKA